MVTKREAATNLITAAGSVSGAYDTLRWFNDAGAYFGPKEDAPTRTQYGSDAEARAHLAEVNADYERRNLTLQGREMALRQEIESSQFNLGEYAAQAAIEESYLGLLRAELEVVGEHIDTERAEATRERDQRFLSMCHEMGPQFDSIDEMVSVLRTFEREAHNDSVLS